MSRSDTHNSFSGTYHGVRERLLMLDGDLCVKAASHSYYAGFNVSPEQTLDRPLKDLGDGQWNVPALLKLLRELAVGHGSLNDFEVEHDFPGVGRRIVLLSARRLLGDDGSATRSVLLGVDDVTERRRIKVELIEQRTSFETTLSSISDAVIVTDAKTRVTYMNPTAQLLTGWSQQGALGFPLAVGFNIMDESRAMTKEQKWARDWMDSVAKGGNKMSSRSLMSIQKRGGGLKAIAAAAKKRKVHLVLLETDKGQKIVAASTKPFRVLA